MRPRSAVEQFTAAEAVRPVLPYSACAPPVLLVEATVAGAGAPPCGVPLGTGAVSGGLSGAGGENGVWPLRSGSRVTRVPLFTLKYPHALFSPGRAASSGPLTGLLPREPSTSAATIRGEAPRLSTSMPRNEPLTRPRRRAAALAKLRLTFQLDALVSYASGTPRSHGSG